MTKKIAVVVPTIRPSSLAKFQDKWEDLFDRHNVRLFVVHDGEDQHVTTCLNNGDFLTPSTKQVAGDNTDLICKFNSSCRNLGLLAVATYAPDTEVILTLDDDCYPIEGTDPIQQHLDVLNHWTTVNWIGTCVPYPRGFPYVVRGETQIKVSHGLWGNERDWDAPSTLLRVWDGLRKIAVFIGAVPKGIYAPLCGMNIAFNIEVLPYAYWAPTADFPGAERFDDIWMGIHLARACWENSWAIYTGASVIWHDRASNVWENLHREHVGLELNETYWQDDFNPPEQYRAWFESYDRKRKRWKELIEGLLARYG